MQCCAVCCSAAHEACPLRRCPSRLFSRKTEAPALKKGGRPGSSRRESRWGRLAKVHQWWTRVSDRAPLTYRERVARHERTGHELFSSSNKLRRRLFCAGGGPGAMTTTRRSDGQQTSIGVPRQMLGGGGSSSRRRAAYAIQSRSVPGKDGEPFCLLHLAVSVLCYRSRNANMASNSSMQASRSVSYHYFRSLWDRASRWIPLPRLLALKVEITG
ncbi:hypothetical protein J3F84DRAFT_112783 [Trichoderma pleuroticola]